MLCNIDAPPIYPCEYRELQIQVRSPVLWHGLPLCIQGTLLLENFPKPFGRFIPVCTGNIRKLSCMRCNRTVYPCVYREHSCCFGIVLTSQRFIPVCTENIKSLIFLPLCFSVYPCVYREHVAIYRFVTFVDGLSLCIQGTRGCAV